MKKTFKMQTKRQIEINEHVFTLRKSNIDIMKKATELQNDCKRLTSIKNLKEDGINELIKILDSIILYVDEILGEGAVKLITNDAPLGIADAVNLLAFICEAVIEEYNETASDKYE